MSHKRSEAASSLLRSVNNGDSEKASQELVGIEALGLLWAKALFRQSGISDIHQLLETPEEDLLQLRGIGKGKLSKIKQCLAEIGLRLKSRRPCVASVLGSGRKADARLRARICVLLSLRPMSAEALALHNGTVRRIDEIKKELGWMVYEGIVYVIPQPNRFGDSVTLYELRETTNA